MSRKQRQQEYALDQAHKAFLDQEARACSTIKTTAYIKPATAAQRLLVKSIKHNDITVGYGPAGTGKTLVTLFNAVQMLNDPNNPIERIIYVRANIDQLEEVSMGALPGDQLMKMKPLAYPILDNLLTFVKDTDANYLIDSGKIEVLPLLMMRGRSFNNTFVLVDEAQNISSKSMKTVLSRLGHGSRMVVVGDVTQCDTRSGMYSNGLNDLIWRLGKVLNTPIQDQHGNQTLPPVGLIEFNKDDIVRHGLTKWVLDLYDELEITA